MARLLKEKFRIVINNHYCPVKKKLRSLKLLDINSFMVFCLKGLTLKPVRAGQGIGRGEA